MLRIPPDVVDNFFPLGTVLAHTDCDLFLLQLSVALLYGKKTCYNIHSHIQSICVKPKLLCTININLQVSLIYNTCVWLNSIFIYIITCTQMEIFIIQG